MSNALTTTPLQDGYAAYQWEIRMHEMLSAPRSSKFYSILFLPKASAKSGQYNDLEDTLTRAHTWINLSQSSGIPIVFMNIQTESLLTKISGDAASATVNAGTLSDLSNIANTSLYGFEDYHGVDIGVVRAVRLWFSPLTGEVPLEIKIREHDRKIGFAISRTEEGFIYISSIMETSNDTPSARSGLNNLFREASRSSRLLVVSRVANQKALPWMVSAKGIIHCFDTVSLSRKLALYRNTTMPILLHVFLWDRNASISNSGSNRARPMSSEYHLPRPLSEHQLLALGMEDGTGSEVESGRLSDGSVILLERDTTGAFVQVP